MKIVLVNTYDCQGGAARAAYRLHQGLMNIGQTPYLLSCYRAAQDDDAVIPILAEPPRPGEADSEFAAIQQFYLNANRTPLSNTFFSLPYPGFDLTVLPWVQAADVINLHWVAFLQSPPTLKKLFALGKPVVWTLHDMWAFTGGCHYSAQCQRYEQDCAACPQLQHDPYQLPQHLLQDKLNSLAEANLTIVAPSQWLADCARRSRLFQRFRVEVIPYSLETDRFIPLEKAVAKGKLGIPKDTITLLFGAGAATEQRKGVAELVQSLQRCLINPQFQALVKEKRVELVCFGLPSELFDRLDMPVRSLGHLESIEELRLVYAAANLFVLPSLEDNLPNTMLEAMCCGTPVLAFDVGGMPDVIRESQTGRLVPFRDLDRFAAAILDCVFHPDQYEKMGQNCRELMQSDYALPIQAERYMTLYKNLLEQHRTTATAAPLPPQQDFAPLDRTLGAQIQQIYHAVLAQSLLTQTAQQTLQVQDLQTQLQQQQQQQQQQQAQLQDLQQQLQDAIATTEAMKTSKFWQLRTRWFQLKHRLGLPTSD